MTDKNSKNPFGNLPDCTADYIRLVIKKMRWRKNVCADVRAELIGHFEDALKDCKTEEEREKTAKELINNFGDAKVLAVLARRAKKRCRPLWQKVLIHSLQALGIIILYIAICAVYINIGKPNISVNYVEWLNDYVRQGRDESLNCTPILEKAARLVVPMPEWLGDSNATWPSDFNETRLQELENWLAQNTAAFEALREALDKPYYWSVYDVNVSDLMNLGLPRLSKYRSLAKAMSWQIRCSAYKNDTEKAVNDVIGLCSFGHRIEGNGLLIEQLVGIAIDAIGIRDITELLSRTILSTEQLEKIQDFFQQSRDNTIIDTGTEKAFKYDFVQRNFTDDGKGGGRPVRQGIVFAGKNASETILNALTFNLPDREEVIAQIDKLYDDLQRSFEIKNYEIRKERYEKTIESAPFMLQLLVPGYDRIATLAWRLRTNKEALITTVAVLRYHKQTNQYPNNLEELLNKGFIDRMPFDAFRNGPLTYRKTDTSFILYSFGEDFDDDGGTPSRWGRPPQGGDQVFWPVTHPAKKNVSGRQ